MTGMQAPPLVHPSLSLRWVDVALRNQGEGPGAEVPQSLETQAWPSSGAKGLFHSQCFPLPIWAMWTIILLWADSQGYRGGQNENKMSRVMGKML